MQKAPRPAGFLCTFPDVGSCRHARVRAPVPQSTLQSLRGLPDPRGVTVAVLGDFVADEYVFGETDRISREAPVPIVRFERSELKLGAAANVAHNLAALGVQVRAVGVVGKDPAGRALTRALRAAGVETEALLASAQVATSVKTRVLAGAPHTTRQQLLRLDRGSAVAPAEARRLAPLLRAAVHGAEALVISDYGVGSAGPWVSALCTRLARVLPVLVDSRFGLQHFRGVTLAKPNTPELQALGARRGESLVALAGRVLEAQRLEALLVTQGRDGMALFRRGERPLRLPVFGPAEAVDVTGAGDTVLATLAAVYARTRDWAEAAGWANLAGGLVVQKPGTAVVTMAELRAAASAGGPT